MKKSLGLLAAAVISTQAVGYELDPIIYSSKTETKASALTSSVTVIEAKDLVEGANPRVSEALKKVAGIEISQAGVVGGQTAVFIRGGEGRHTVIMVDGVKVFDPTSISRTMNLSSFNLGDIERIEVLKGPQSVLYGSDAMAGVINIITKKGSAKNIIKVGAGITRDLGLAHTVNFDKGLIGFSAQYQEANENSDADGGKKDLNINKGFTLTSDFNFGKLDSLTVIKVTENYKEIDAQDSKGLPVDAEGLHGRDLHSLFRQKTTYQSDSKTKRILDISLNRYERLNKYNGGKSYYDGSSTNIEYRAIRKRSNGVLVTGFQEQSETYRDSNMKETSQSATDLFGNRLLTFGTHHFEIGARLTKSKDFGEHGVYSLGVKKELSEKLSIYISNKTGFKAPSTYQLFGEYNGTKSGNEDLTPEKSVSYEVGAGYKSGQFSSGLSLFQNEVENYIGFENSAYVNIDGAITRGFEAYFDFIKAKSEFGLNLNLIHYDLSTGEKAIRRPSQSVNIYYQYKLDDIHSFGSDLRYRGVRYGIAKTDYQEMDAYSVLDLNYAYTKKEYKFIGSIKNLLNEDYETSIDYEVQGFGVQANIEYYY